MKISRRVFYLLPGHEIMTDGRTDRQTDGQGDYYRTPPTSSGGALASYTLQRTRVTKFHTDTFIRELGFTFKIIFSGVLHVQELR